MAAQLAPLLTVELMPYFLKSPFSCAITMLEQSVSAMMPSLMSAVSGASLAKTLPVQLAGKPARSDAAVVRRMNERRLMAVDVLLFMSPHPLAAPAPTSVPCGITVRRLFVGFDEIHSFIRKHKGFAEFDSV